jgi:G3E family GTPase
MKEGFSVPMTGRMPVILLTGFLGSGKTTLLLRWLSESPATGLRIGIVMNEFGAESVDGQLVRRPGLAIRQVDGGCVCCAPDNELDRACREMARSGECDFLVIETSGLADPDNVIDVLTDMDLLPVVRLQAVVTVVDAPWFLRPVDGIAERVLARRQVQFAQVVCLSKCDVLAPGEADAVEAGVREWNPKVTCVPLPFGLPDLGEILRRDPGECALEELPRLETGGAHLHQQYQSFSWRFPAPVSRQDFETYLASLDDREVVRAKGFVRFKESPGQVHLFQRVWGHHLIDVFPAKPDPEAFGVLIGPGLDVARQRERLRKLMGAGRPGLGLVAG